MNPCYCRSLKKHKHDLCHKYGWVKRVQTGVYHHDRCVYVYQCSRCSRQCVKTEIINDTRPSDWRTVWAEQRAIAKKKVATLLIENPIMSLNELSKHVGVSRATVRKYKYHIQQEQETVAQTSIRETYEVENDSK